MCFVNPTYSSLQDVCIQASSEIVLQSLNLYFVYFTLSIKIMNQYIFKRKKNMIFQTVKSKCFGSVLLKTLMTIPFYDLSIKYNTLDYTTYESINLKFLQCWIHDCFISENLPKSTITEPTNLVLFYLFFCKLDSQGQFSEARSKFGLIMQIYANQG